MSAFKSFADFVGALSAFRILNYHISQQIKNFRISNLEIILYQKFFDKLIQMETVNLILKNFIEDWKFLEQQCLKVCKIIFSPFTWCFCSCYCSVVSMDFQEGRYWFLRSNFCPRVVQWYTIQLFNKFFLLFCVSAMKPLSEIISSGLSPSVAFSRHGVVSCFNFY